MNSFDMSLECSSNEPPQKSIAIQLPLNSQETKTSELIDRTSRSLSSHKVSFKEQVFQIEEEVIETEEIFDLERDSVRDYARILLCELNSKSLISKFMEEISFLRLSDAVGEDFSFRASARRLQLGYTIIFFNYKTSEAAKGHLSADGYGISLKLPFSREKFYPYHHFKGLVIGAKSSTFLKHKKTNYLHNLGLEHTDCFSLLSNLQSYDFGTHSDLAKYDIWLIFIKYHCAISNDHGAAAVPLNKYQFTMLKVKYKIQEMARKRYISIKELFLLAIAKTLIQRNAEPRKIKIVTKYLDRMFKADTKFHRIIHKILTPELSKSKMFQANFDNSMRVLALNRKMAMPAIFKDTKNNEKVEFFADTLRFYEVYKLNSVKVYLKKSQNRKYYKEV